MPYHVPLQGIEGGKRTLVILDDLVSFLLHCDTLHISHGNAGTNFQVFPLLL